MIEYTDKLIENISQILSNGYIGLIKTDGFEVVANEYRRIQFAPLKVVRTNNAFMICNSTVLQFQMPLSDWGYIRSIALYSSEVSQKILFTYTLPEPIEIRRNVKYIIEKESIQLFFTKNNISRTTRTVTVVSRQGMSQTFTTDPFSDITIYVDF